MLHQYSNLVQKRIVRAVQIQNIQIFRVQGIAIRKTVMQRRYRPFHCKIFAFRAVKAKTKVVVLSAKSKGRNFNNQLGAVVYRNQLIHLEHLLCFVRLYYITLVIVGQWVFYDTALRNKCFCDIMPLLVQ